MFEALNNTLDGYKDLFHINLLSNDRFKRK